MAPRNETDPAGTKALLDKGVPVDLRESAWGQTALMWAAAYDRVAAVEVLAARGASLKATSKVNNVGNLSSTEQDFLAQASGSGNQAGGNGQGRNGQVVAPGAAPAQAGSLSGRTVLTSKALAGYLKTAGGRELVFALFVNNVHLERSAETARIGKTLGRICEALHAAE